jgi:hypothetical protein
MRADSSGLSPMRAASKSEPASLLVASRKPLAAMAPPTAPTTAIDFLSPPLNRSEKPLGGFVAGFEAAGWSGPNSLVICLPSPRVDDWRLTKAVASSTDTLDPSLRLRTISQLSSILRISAIGRALPIL